MTSLVGFEALLRGKRVATYGRPFYSGWGLTDDRHPLARRTRRLTLDQLCAGVLLRYPRYLDPGRGVFTSPEDVLTLLQRERAAQAEPVSVRQPWASRQWRKLVHTYKALVPRVR
jgi:capsular polysaccharide export protein